MDGIQASQATFPKWHASRSSEYTSLAALDNTKHGDGWQAGFVVEIEAHRYFMALISS